MVSVNCTRAENIHSGILFADTPLGRANSFASLGFGNTREVGPDITNNCDVDVLNALAHAKGVCGVFGTPFENGALDNQTVGHRTTFLNTKNVILNDISSLTDVSAALGLTSQITSNGDDTEIGGNGNVFALVAAVTICSFAAKGMTK